MHDMCACCHGCVCENRNVSAYQLFNQFPSCFWPFKVYPVFILFWSFLLTGFQQLTTFKVLVHYLYSIYVLCNFILLLHSTYAHIFHNQSCWLLFRLRFYIQNICCIYKIQCIVINITTCSGYLSTIKIKLTWNQKENDAPTEVSVFSCGLFILSKQRTKKSWLLLPLYLPTYSIQTWDACRAVQFLKNKNKHKKILNKSKQFLK